jgi:histidinol-phosphate aminotransferase
MIEPKEAVRNLSRMWDIGSDRSNYMRLDKNERTIPFEKSDFKKILAKLDSELISMYPDQSTLYDKLSGFLKTPKENILLTAGSDAGIKAIFETYVNSGDEVIFLDPTYAMIEVYSNLYNANKIKIGYDSKLQLEYDKLIESITINTKLIIIANPNQPSGTVLDEDQVERLLLLSNKFNFLLVFDEAYQQFSGQDSLAKFVGENENLVVLQTFSKAFGAASIRLGYIISQKQNINYIYKVKPYADINMFSIKVGEYLIDNYNIIEDYVKEVTQSKSLIKEELKPFGIKIINSHTNFIHLRFPKKYNLSNIADKLKDKNILVRVTGSGLPAVLKGCIRITVGSVNQMNRFVDELKDIIISKIN